MDDEQTPLHNEQSATAANRLRRLQAHSRTNLPALLTHRALSTFTLHNEPLPQQATERVLVVVYPQDPFVGDPEVRTMSAADIQPGLVNSRVRVDVVGSPSAQPDEDGNYLYWPGDPRFDQVNAFYFTTFTLRMYERYAKRALPWSFPSPRLSIQTDVGDDANAFYSEQDRAIGFHAFELGEQTINTAHSADIISHEAAHAVLDGIRDLYNESFGLGPTAFHEAFSDITAMLVALHDDSLIKRMLEWTEGDLHRDNFVSQMAEYLNDVLTNTEELRLQAHNLYLRNAINDFKQVPFEDLEYAPADPAFTLGRQSHNYSRLLTGTFYDVFAALYDRIHNAGTPPHIAIYKARDIAASILIFMLELGPVGEFDFSDLARCALNAESILYDGQYQSILLDVLADRGILSQKDAKAHLKSLAALPALQLPETVNSALASALFLEQTVLPALKLSSTSEFVPLAAYRNASGYAFFTYFANERMTLKGAEYGSYESAGIEIYGGLTLCFDPDGRLRSAYHRPVTETDKQQIGVLTRDLIHAGLITDDFYIQPDTIRYQRPKGVILRDNITGFADEADKDEGEGGQLIRYPAIFDLFPASTQDIVSYFRQMVEKIRRH